VSVRGASEWLGAEMFLVSVPGDILLRGITQFKLQDETAVVSRANYARITENVKTSSFYLIWYRNVIHLSKTSAVSSIDQDKHIVLSINN
jgi:hypothetical protein